MRLPIWSTRKLRRAVGGAAAIGASFSWRRWSDHGDAQVRQPVGPRVGCRAGQCQRAAPRRGSHAEREAGLATLKESIPDAGALTVQQVFDLARLQDAIRTVDASGWKAE